MKIKNREKLQEVHKESFDTLSKRERELINF